MSTKSLAKLVLVLVQVSLLDAVAQASDREFRGITIRVIDEVGVPAKEWQAAQLFADKILRTGRSVGDVGPLFVESKHG